MEYNKKEELFDKIGGLNLVNPDGYGAKYNKGVLDSLSKIVSFFNKELIPEVPQFVADWYEEHKGDFEFSVFNHLYPLDHQECSIFKKWLADSKTEPFKVLVNMHQFGYKVKKDKKYKVKMKGVNENSCVLKYYHDTERWIMGTSFQYNDARLYHTKEELEAGGFGGVFNDPLFEVEEVEEND